MRPSARAVFLDRDGTLIRDRHYASDPDRIELLDGVVQGLRSLHEADYRLVVVTNQSGVARGYFREVDVLAMHRRLDAMLRAEHVPIVGYYYCPHHLDGVVPDYRVACECRKPQPGLLHQASAAVGVDLRRSWVVGDAETDVLAGVAAGCRTILLADDEHAPGGAAATHVAPSLLEASRLILAADGPGARRRSLSTSDPYRLAARGTR